MRLLLCSLALALLTLSGCEQGKQSVSGSVKYDGQPVAQGDIIFEPDDKTIGAEGGKIVDGKFTANLPKGKFKVRILANRNVPGKKGPMGEELIEQYIPAKYNEQTTLTAEVTADKKPIEFDLAK